MSRIALSHKAAKLMKLCDLEGYKRLHDLLRASTTDSLCPAICMTEGCDYTTEMERDQDAGYCEACGGNTMVSALVLAGFAGDLTATNFASSRLRICIIRPLKQVPR